MHVCVPTIVDHIMSTVSRFTISAKPELLYTSTPDRLPNTKVRLSLSPFFVTSGLKPDTLLVAPSVGSLLHFFMASIQQEAGNNAQRFLVLINMIASHCSCRFVVSTSVIQISRSNTSQMCSTGLRSANCGGQDISLRCSHQKILILKGRIWSVAILR